MVTDFQLKYINSTFLYNLVSFYKINKSYELQTMSAYSAKRNALFSGFGGGENKTVFPHYFFSLNPNNSQNTT